jgi:hypothetical protein
MARIIEQLTPLIISINVRNKVRADIRITGLDKRPGRWSCRLAAPAGPSWHAECSTSRVRRASWCSRAPARGALGHGFGGFRNTGPGLCQRERRPVRGFVQPRSAAPATRYSSGLISLTMPIFTIT